MTGAANVWRWGTACVRRWFAGFDRGTLRAIGFVALLTVVFLVTNTAVAAAATDEAASGGGLLGPLDVLSSEGAPLSGYQLESMSPNAGLTPAEAAIKTGGIPYDAVGEIQRMLLSGLFTLVRLLVGMSCWLIGFVFKFPITTLLTDPAQKIADGYERHVVAPLGIEGLFLAWAFIFGLILFVRGKVGTGLGEITMTLFIVAFAASAFVRPDYLLGKDGPVAQTHKAAIEVASITTTSYFGGAGSCATGVAQPNPSCLQERDRARSDVNTVTVPIQNALTDALVVKPYMLLQYGRVLDPKKASDKAAYAAHKQWVMGNGPQKPVSGEDAKKKCEGAVGPLKESCEKSLAEQEQKDPCGSLHGESKKYCESAVTPCDRFDNPQAKEYCENGTGPGREVSFQQLITNLEKADSVGKECAEFAKKPTWDRVWSVVALLLAVIVVTLMVISMSVVMLGAQGADAAAAAGGPIAWVWSMLPGPSRMLLWRWFGVFIISAMVSFMAAMALPLFGIAVDAVLSEGGPDTMVERLLLVDAIAVAFLIMHRRVLAATAGFGQRMASRMRYKKVGGSHLSGDNSEIGAAIAMHGRGGGGGGGGGVGLGGSLGRLAAMSDGAGTAMSPGRLLGDALAEGRRGFAPIAMVLRGAHTALIGPKPRQHPAVALLAAVAGQNAVGAVPGKAGAKGELVVDEWTGHILHDPDTDRPLLGSRIHAGASRLRGYRIASRTARVAYGATLGLPRTIHRANTIRSEFTDDVRQQLDVARYHVREDAAAWQPVFQNTHEAAQSAGRAVRDTAISAAIYAAPLAGSGAGPGPRASISRQDTPAWTGENTPATSTVRPTRRVDLTTDSAQPPTPRPDPIRPRPVRPAPRTAPGPSHPLADPNPTSAQPTPPRPNPIRPRPVSNPTPNTPSRSRQPDDAAAAANAERLRRRFDERVAERRRREEAGDQ
ncbi:hypothetical protein J7I97_32080 [Streptomyces sp. ISL-87]|uniref:hypothetical protein n=1 Tax=Streptomyces sp. ISL-87 TaxID=2819188 RepID=UPI001BEA8ED9|nr:hypothetical protein [Streptomyces sp. ISL-87]MBT2612736.1 hypothetical protein [Streptomyces sp. ISL-87]